jgi:hypothetical protein
MDMLNKHGLVALERESLRDSKFKVVSLFDTTKGSRYHQMVNQGLIAHPDVVPVFQESVTSFDGVIADPVDNQSDLIHQMTLADIILFPGIQHYRFPQALLGGIERYRLWNKCVTYDFSDGEHISDVFLQRCNMYIKRTSKAALEPEEVPNGRILHLPYGPLYEYVEPVDYLRDERDIDIAFLMTPDPTSPTQVSRQATYNALTDLAKTQEFQKFNISIGQEAHDGRRAIIDHPDSPDNAFRRYMDKLHRAKIIVTVQPDHLGGDSRLWEALLSGAVVVSNDLGGQKLGLVDGNHYMSFNPHGDIQEFKALLLALLHDVEAAVTRHTIAMNGRNHVLQHHMPPDRVETILKYTAAKWR